MSDLIEAMARAVMLDDGCGCTAHDGKRVLCTDAALEDFAELECSCADGAKSALAALRKARPDIADVLDGKAVVVPVEISKDDAEGIWETAYDVWAEFGATEADAGREAHRAALAASPYRSA